MINGFKLTVIWMTSMLGCLGTTQLFFICGLRKTSMKAHSVLYQLNYTGTLQCARSSARDFISQESLKTIEDGAFLLKNVRNVLGINDTYIKHFKHGIR